MADEPDPIQHYIAANTIKMKDTPHDYPVAAPEMSEAEWLEQLHGEDDRLQQVAAELHATYVQLGSPQPIETGHWLALASAVLD